MRLIQNFKGPGKKGRPFYGWAGPVVEWPEKSAPKIAFGEWTKNSVTGGGSVTFECAPFQLCMFGANSAKMDPRDKFTYFAFAGLGADGNLRLQVLPDGADARTVFAEGGWVPPAETEISSRISDLPKLDFKQQIDKALEVAAACNVGFGMGFPLPRDSAEASEKLDAFAGFVSCMAQWPQLAAITQAFQSFSKVHSQELEKRRAEGRAIRKTAVEKVITEMLESGFEVTPITVAARMLNVTDGEIPYQVKEKARRLKREFGEQFFDLSNSAFIKP